MILYKEDKKINKRMILAGGEHVFFFKEAKEWIMSKDIIDYLQFDVNSLSFDKIIKLKQKLKKLDKIFIPHNWTSPIITSMSLSLLKIFKQKKFD